MTEPVLPQPRMAALFRDEGGQSVRIPPEFELPGGMVRISRSGERLIIEPVRKKGLLALLASWEPLDEDLPDIEDRALGTKN